MQDSQAPRPPAPGDVASRIDRILKKASQSILDGSDFKYKTDRGNPSKEALLKLFAGDFKGKLSSWRKATPKRGTPRNQLLRTEELIAIFSSDNVRLFGGTTPIVPKTSRDNFQELSDYLFDACENDRKKILCDLIEYRAQLVHFYSQVQYDYQPEKESERHTFEGDGGPFVPPAEVSPNKDFGSAILVYAKYLKSTRRHNPLVELRNKLTHLFHLLGLNSERENFGKLALESSVICGDVLSRAEIMIDDLGWAVHLQGRTPEAKENIEAAADLLSSFESRSLEKRVRAKRARAKAFRHLAFLDSKSLCRQSNLDQCESEIKSLMSNHEASSVFADAIKCDHAQWLHAVAHLTARELKIHDGGELSPDDSVAREQAKEALKLAEQAVDAFADIGDMERQVKALVLVERLHESQGARLKALETKAVRQEILSKSQRLLEGRISFSIS